MRLTLLILIALSVLITHKSAEASSADSSRISKTESDISALASAVDLFYRDMGRYPTTEEGLESLMTPIKASESNGDYDSIQYIKKLPNDPWGTPYQYRSPGINNIDKFDIWTLGADRMAGGEGLNGDYGNWEGSFEPFHEAVENERRFEAIWFAVLYGVPIGGLIGAPVYLFGVFKCIRQNKTLKASLGGFHLVVLIYLMLLLPAVAIALNVLPL